MEPRTSLNTAYAPNDRFQGKSQKAFCNFRTFKRVPVSRSQLRASVLQQARHRPFQRHAASEACTFHSSKRFHPGFLYAATTSKAAAKLRKSEQSRRP